MTIEQKENAVIELEWNFFQNVQNEGGRASCQDDPHTFQIMRKSQFCSWSEEMIDSYLEDLKQAAAEGRNPITEKYAWMMQDTAPQKFQEICGFLPELSTSARQLIDEITQIQLDWMDIYTSTYPHVAAGNRATRQADAFPGDTSFESYLRGELATYSTNTLKLYLAHARQVLSEGGNLVLVTMNETVKCYGYKDLDDAETRMTHPKN